MYVDFIGYGENMNLLKISKLILHQKPLEFRNPVQFIANMLLSLRMNDNVTLWGRGGGGGSSCCRACTACCGCCTGPRVR